MKFNKFSAFSIMLLAMLAFAPLSAQAAGEALQASHQITSQQQSAAGTAITTEMRVTNTGAEALSNVSIELIDSMLPAAPGSNVVSVGSLAAGESKVVEWIISTVASVFPSGAPLLISIQAVNASGQSVDIQITSNEEVAQ